MAKCPTQASFRASTEAGLHTSGRDYVDGLTPGFIPALASCANRGFPNPDVQGVIVKSSARQRGPLQVGDGIVHFWRIRTTDDSGTAEERSVLSPIELARADRFHFDRDRQSFIRSHSALRHILAKYTGVAAHRLSFNLSEFGKPSLDLHEDHAIHFNLSHSGDIAVVAVASARVGVDVERWDPNVEFLELATHYFSPAERLALSALNGTELLMQGFFQAWSRKEAYLKATGTGISVGLHHFDVSLTPGQPAQLLADRKQPDAPTRWSMQSIDVHAGYSAAVVVSGTLKSIDTFNY